MCANRTTAGFAGPKQPPLCSPRGGSQCSPAQAARYWRYVDAFAQADRMPPWNDTVLANSIMAFTTAKPNGAGRSAQVGQALQHVLIPDELSADLGSSGHAGYLGVETKTGNFGGRGPSTDVINPSLGAIFGDTVAKSGLAPDDHAETPCLTNDNLQPERPRRHFQLPVSGYGDLESTPSRRHGHCLPLQVHYSIADRQLRFCLHLVRGMSLRDIVFPEMTTAKSAVTLK